MSAAVMPTALENRRHSSTTSNSSNNNCKRVMYERQLHLATSCVSQISNWEHSSRHRNLSGPSSTGRTRPTVDSGGRTLTTPPPGFTGSSSVMDGQSLAVVSTKDSRHRNLDRSHSDSSEQDRINGNPRGVINSSRYKTELCRPFEENGHCKYGDKCQFAHGMHELRNLSRHPKYKTERCRTYHTIGFCPYGPRCHFIHNDEERAQSKGRQQAISSSGRPRNLSGLSSIGSSFESMSTSSNSPGNLSPVLPAEDQFPSITTFSVSDVTPQNSTPTPSSSSPRRPNGSIFNFPASDANHVSNSPFVPLGVQTDQFFNNVHDLQMLYQDQRYSVQANVNINANIILQEKQQRQQQQQDPIWFSDNKLQEELDFLLFPIPSSSPVSSDSMGSSSSLDEVSSVIASNPLDVGRSMRLPIFNQLT